MIYLLLFQILILLCFIIFLLINNAQIKGEHTKNMERLHDVIISLNSKQKTLNDKVIISTDYNTNYSKDMKAIGDEVVELQKVFIDIITNRNYK